MEEFDLGEVVAQAAQTHRALFDHKKIAVATPIVSPAVRVLADRDKIIQVLTNLLSNAAKFTPPGGHVWVRTFRESSQAVVEVEDTGVGISPEQLGAIFERFRQVGDTLAGNPDWTGLGLPISREIVQHHGGTLTAWSRPGQGSCFRMTLPILALHGTGSHASS